MLGWQDKRGVKAYWGAHQRFFRQLITALKVPHVVAQCRQALEDGHCAVIGLQSTGEAGLNYAAEDLGIRAGDAVPGNALLSPTYWSAHRFLADHFPVRFAAKKKGVGDDDGGSSSSSSSAAATAAGGTNGSAIALDMSDDSDGEDSFAAAQAEYHRLQQEKRDALLMQAHQHASSDQYAAGIASAMADAAAAKEAIRAELEGKPIPELVEAKQALQDRLEALREKGLPACALDTLIEQLGGPSKVAEMTGRSRRVVRSARTGRMMLQNRVGGGGGGKAGEDPALSDVVNICEKNLFVQAKRLVAIISDAASTGISLHAGLGFVNKRGHGLDARNPTLGREHHIPKCA